MNIKNVVPIEAATVGDLPPSSPEESLRLAPDPDGREIALDNHLRARRACGAISSHSECSGGSQESPSIAIGDLLADLMHLCDCLDIDFVHSMARATMHYEAELKG